MEFSIDAIDTFVALGGTFQSHLDEKDRAYRWPDLWVYPDSAVVSEGEPIRIPEQTEQIKPGSELTAVIGEPIHEVEPEAAWAAVDGFTVSNDVTAAGDWPGWSDPDHGMITGVGYKLFASFAPILTEYVERRELAHYEDLSVAVDVDGAASVRGSTRQLSFTIPELVSFASRIVPLTPGDVVALGDPGRPDLLLDDADEVTCVVESVGKLTNPIERA
jgi:2-keto-4-pentenoate hydratase/2-oxohepta-3-ene-1,7-dioic acid hydratase in catechol pathway